MNKKTVMVSGGFDPIHVGHVRMILAAAAHGDVIVVANSDNWLVRKKGYCFMPFEERKEIIEPIRGVSKVVSVNDDDNTVCTALIEHTPDFFANGGDRKEYNTPEKIVCEASLPWVSLDFYIFLFLHVILKQIKLVLALANALEIIK